jgi:thiamine pyrophosphokinase
MSLADYLSGVSTDHLYLIGPFFQGALPLAQAMVFVDRGADFRVSSEGYSVGDGDSASVLLDQKLDARKDFSDLAYVFSHIPNQMRRITLLGFLGGRRDHELMNLAESHRLLRQRPGLRLDFENQILGYSAGTWDLEIKSQFSLFSFEKNNLFLTGDCEYPVQGYLQELSSHGLSNVGRGRIRLSSDAPVFIFL